VKPAILLATLRGTDRLAEALLDRRHVDLIALYPETAADLDAKGIPCDALDVYSDDKLKSKCVHIAHNRIQLLGKHVQSPTFRRYYTPIPNIRWPAVRDAVLSHAQRDMAECILLIELIARCAADTDLRAVVVQEDYGRDTRSAIAAAHRYGIPALHILHSIPYQTQNLHDVLAADVVAAQGTRAKAIIEDFGMPPERVVVTGGLEWDEYAEPPLPGHRDRACADFGLDPARPIVGYAGTFTHAFSETSARHPDYHDKIANAVIDAFASLSQQHPDWQFVLRPHPGDNRPPEEILTRAHAAGLEHAGLSIGPVGDFLVTLDALVCIQSNVGVEALLRGVPVINAAIEEFGGPVFNEGYGSLFQADDPILDARTPDEIAPAVEKAITDETTCTSLRARWQEVIPEFVHRADGQSVARIADLILEIADNPAQYAPPIQRYPEIETALSQAVPRSTTTIAVLGASAEHVINRIAHDHPNIHIANDNADVIVIADPLPNDETAEHILRDAQTRLAENGAIICAARFGKHESAIAAFEAGTWAPARPGYDPPIPVNEYTEPGLALVLARAGLEAAGLRFVNEDEPVICDAPGANTVAIIARAASRAIAPGPYGQAIAAACAEAESLNKQGEHLFEQGDIRAASAKFLAAIRAGREYAIAHNNLGIALQALGQPEDAYARIYRALHLDPNLQSARDNLRDVGQSLGREHEAESILSLWGQDTD